ncbi:MAG: threonine aldolase [Cytophagales bacterium]|nr:MAG: threonine aldolase [Cytophagales bacterium]
MRIDLRSDTLTRPTPEMLLAMQEAKVGDDVYEEDPTVNLLQERLAQMFGVEAALFCPSGTMTNQIAIKALTQPQDEVICYKQAHIYKYEGGGLAFNAQLSVKLIDKQDGILKPQDIISCINPDDIHYPTTRLVALENTANRGGGAYYRLQEDIIPIRHLCNEHQLFLHLDGARLWNALAVTNEKPEDYGKTFDSISVCFSKSLGCPVGSALLGSKALIKRGKRLRKVLGGGWRQAGFLAAAVLYALDNHRERLEEDHQRAAILAEALRQKSYVKYVMPAPTNIVIFQMENTEIAQKLVNYLQSHNCWIGKISEDSCRMVTHLDFTDLMLESLLVILHQFNP